MTPPPPPRPRTPSYFTVPEPKIDPYRPRHARRLLRVLGLTLVTVVVLWFLLLVRPGGHPRRILPSPPQPCAPGQTTNCVGGDTTVQLLPAQPVAPSGAAAGASR